MNNTTDDFGTSRPGRIDARPNSPWRWIIPTVLLVLAAIWALSRAGDNERSTSATDPATDMRGTDTDAMDNDADDTNMPPPAATPMTPDSPATPTP